MAPECRLPKGTLLSQKKKKKGATNSQLYSQENTHSTLGNCLTIKSNNTKQESFLVYSSSMLVDQTETI